MSILFKCQGNINVMVYFNHCLRNNSPISEYDSVVTNKDSDLNEIYITIIHPKNPYL